MSKRRGGGVDLTRVPLNEYTAKMFPDSRLKKMAAEGNELAKAELERRQGEREEFDT